MCVLQIAYDTWYNATKPRGRAMIIANVSFFGLPPRHGTEVDIQNLERVFSWLHFEVVVHENLSRHASILIS